MTDFSVRNQVFTPDAARNAGIQTTNVMRDDFNMDIPVESVPLPSEGKIYSEQTGFCDKQTVDIKAMTAREEDILTSRALIKKGTVISELLRSCIVDKSVNVDSLISGDRNALMIAVRITGYGAEYKLDLPCPKCDVKSDQIIDLSSLNIKRLKIQPVEQYKNAFEFVLPISKKKVIFKFLTGNDEIEMTTEADRKKKAKLSGDVDNFVTSRLIYSILSIDNITDKSKISTFIKNMPARDSQQLRKFIDDNEPGIQMESEIYCSHCDETSEVTLPIGASFFWPDA